MSLFCGVNEQYGQKKSNDDYGPDEQDIPFVIHFILICIIRPGGSKYIFIESEALGNTLVTRKVAAGSDP